jgi:hypothetical protein
MAIIQTKNPKERKPGPEPSGRICTEPGCETVLSTYNCGDTCAQHGGWPKDEVTDLERRDAFAELMAA